MDFDHVSLELTDRLLTAYTAMSKRLFYFREQISTYVANEHYVPLNPFMIFGYFLNDKVPRDLIRQENNTLVQIADELWVFGDVSDGVLAEIMIARQMNKPVKYFKIEHSRDIIPISLEQVVMEDEVRQYKDKLYI